jgi:hypothetical protein
LPAEGRRLASDPRLLPPEGGRFAAGRHRLLPAWARAGAKSRWLAAISTSRWLLPLGIAVGAHALWLSGSSLSVKPRPPAPRLPVTDNTPELLRFSSGARQPVALAASLSTIELPFGNSLPLPPPPPPPLEAGQTTPRRSAAPAAPAPRSAAGSSGRSGLAWGVPAAASAGLPASAASALELVAQLQIKAGAAAATSAASTSPGSSSAVSTAAGPDASSPPTATERPAKAEGQTAAGAALARRHLRLDANADRPYRLLWDTGAPSSNRPDSLSDLPEGVEVRRLPLAAAQAMGLNQPHGVSVQSSTGLLLLWVQGDQLWLIRQAAGTTRTAA